MRQPDGESRCTDSPRTVSPAVGARPCSSATGRSASAPSSRASRRSPMRSPRCVLTPEARTPRTRCHSAATSSRAGRYVHGDHAALLRVLLNLLDNAVRHAHSTVELTVCGDPDGVTFAVRDDGDGIADADLPHLFDPLFRGDRARSGTTGGAGLGLAIVD